MMDQGNTTVGGGRGDGRTRGREAMHVITPDRRREQAVQVTVRACVRTCVGDISHFRLPRPQPPRHFPQPVSGSGSGGGGVRCLPRPAPPPKLTGAAMWQRYFGELTMASPPRHRHMRYRSSVPRGVGWRGRRVRV